MALSEVSVKQAKPKEKQYKLADERGLVLMVFPNGRKHWRLRYSWQGKENMIAIGPYPECSLKEARIKRDEFRLLLAQGINPNIQKTKNNEITFKMVAEEWYQKHVLPIRSKGHSETVISRLERLIYPYLGHRPIMAINAQDILTMLKPLEAREIMETARRTLQIAGQVFRYAVALGQAERDPTGDLRGALPPKKTKHHASMTDPRQVSELLKAMQSFQGGMIVQSALWFSAYTFVRPGEVRHAEWSEINVDTAEWRIPAEKMKLRRPHIVPLSKQVIKILEQLEPATGHGKYIFPSCRNLTKGDRPMSDGTILSALRRMGYSKEEMTPHGFRSMASTILHEQGWNSDVIERQLAHVETNTVKAAYNYAEHLPKRREMMQWWADHIDSLTQ